jgi:hypothetical protein
MKNEGVMMSVMTDNGVLSLKKVRRQLDAAHREACNAMACFDTDRADNSLPIEERIAARSLLDQMVPLCAALRTAMNAVPEAAQPKAYRMSEVRDHRSELPCTRTAFSMLQVFRSRNSAGKALLETAHRMGHALAR